MLIPSDPQDRLSSTQREAEKFVQSTLDALSAHVAILDERGNIIGVNAAWRDFADANGFSTSNYGLGSNYLAVCDAATARKSKDAPIVAMGIRDIMNGHLNEFEMEYPCHSPMQRRWFVVRVSRFEWYNAVRLIIAHQNVTELKQVQIELSESHRRIEAILDNINNAIITVDVRGVIENVNKAASTIFGYATDDLIGKHMSEIVDAPFDKRTTFKRLNGRFGHELNGMRADGELFPIHLSLNELKLDDGTLYTCIVQDITYRKRMEAEIIERERVTVALEKEREIRELKNRFLSMMGHELKTPLAQIRLAHDMLKTYGQRASSEDRIQYLETIETQVAHLDDMVSDVVQLSKGEMGVVGVEKEDVDLITYCRDVVEEFQFTPTHQVEFNCPDPILRAPIDRKLLRRAFTNLLSNAIKYTPEGGRVDFDLHGNDTEAIISVRDTGIGIPEDDLPRLFEPFHRARNVGTVKGTGLGLAIAKQTVELHGGSISVESSFESGTTFIIRLPL